MKTVSKNLPFLTTIGFWYFLFVALIMLGFYQIMTEHLSHFMPSFSSVGQSQIRGKF